MNRRYAVMGAIFGGLAVVAGAFGAHGLRDVLSVEAMGWYETAARYQLMHAVVLLVIGIGWNHLARGGATWAGRSMVMGILVFSGTLYAMAFGGPRWLGAVTPLGGLGLIVGWFTLAWAAWRGSA